MREVHSSAYIVSFAVIFALAMMIAASINIFAFKYNADGYSALAVYQFNKLKHLEKIDIAVVGDSSGGNGVDAGYLGELTQKKVVSLSLTGSFGYAGSYFMAQKAIERGAKKIVLIHTVDTLTRAVDGERSVEVLGFLAADSGLERLWFPQLYFNLDTLRGIIKGVSNPSASRPNEAVSISQNDYWPQRDSVTINKDISFSKNDINSEKTRYLLEIAKLCTVNDVECIYLHGPIHESFCKKENGYLEEANAIIARAGVPLYGGPYCMTDKEMGDADDHISPSYKKNSTTFYYNAFLKSI